MKKIYYSLTGVDEEGNTPVEIELPEGHVSKILLDLIAAGVAKVTILPDQNYEVGHTVTVSPESLDRVFGAGKTMKGERDVEPAGDKSSRGASRQKVIDLHKAGMRDPHAIAEKLGMSVWSVTYHLKGAGLEYDTKRGRRKKQEAESGSAHPSRGEIKDDYKTVRMKELLREGKGPGEIAEELDSTVPVVNFVRRQMISRGELKE